MIDLRKKNDVVVFHQILFYQELQTLIMRTFHDEITTFISYTLNMRDLKKKSEALLCFQLHFSLHFKYEIFNKKYL